MAKASCVMTSDEEGLTGSLMLSQVTEKQGRYRAARDESMPRTTDGAKARRARPPAEDCIRRFSLFMHRARIDTFVR